jgi:two-component system response regulator FixJ
MANSSVIHVVEDDQPMRDSLVMLLEEAGYKVRAYAMGEDLMALGAATEPGCVVSDVRMPGMDGLTLLRRLRAGGSALPLILITGHGDISMAVTAMKAGAFDFLEKPFEADALLAAIESALRLRSSDANAEDAETARRRLEKLTSREYEVLDHLVAGKSNKEAAAKLGISPRTVEFHRAHIMEKTGAKGLPELVRLWLATRALPESQYHQKRVPR